MKVLLVSNGGLHDFVVDEFGGTVRVSPGEEPVVVEFVADKKGTFEYYCSVGAHRERGMFGQFIVE